jgi:hypothetical protein
VDDQSTFQIGQLRVPSLLFGLAFLAVAVLALVAEHSTSIEGTWVAVAAFGAVGIAGVISVIWSIARR